MSIFGKLKASLDRQPAVLPDAPIHDSSETRLWERLDSPDGTHIGSLRPDFVPIGVLEAIVDAPRSVLDVGCFCGGAGAALKRKWPDARITGIEPLAQAAKVARKHIDRVFQGVLDDAGPDDLGMPDQGFDLIICADVLEHMHNPWSALARLHTMLADDGALIASIPNARNLGLILDLACRGRWQYQNSGLLDITHLRFFTLTEIKALFQETGFGIASIGHHLDARFSSVVDSSDAAATLKVETLTIENLSAEDRRELATLQFIIRAVKAV